MNVWLLLLQNPELVTARTNYQKLEADVHEELAMQGQRARGVQASISFDPVHSRVDRMKKGFRLFERESFFTELAMQGQTARGVRKSFPVS